MNVVSVDPMIYTFNPVDALHEEKEREEKDRAEIESASPPLIYNAPPFSIAEQDSNEREERDSLCSEVRVNEIAPPFVDEQFVYITPERVISDGREVNSNTPPFPDSLLIDENVFVPDSLSESIDTSINDVLSVVTTPVDDVNVILLRVSVPSDTTINEHPLLIVFFTSIVNALNVAVFTVNVLPTPASAAPTSNVTLAYDPVLSVG